MLQFLAELAIYEVPRGFGWAILKLVTLGRYRGSHPADCVTEGVVGLAGLAGLAWLTLVWL
jgi:hypothetical protein